VSNALHEKALIPVADPTSFGVVRSAIEAAFSGTKVREFLRAVQRASLRIRDFEDVLHKGLLGKTVESAYTALGNGDQGQIRELYLASLEKVSPDLRGEFFKVYAYY
jgi:hypothetical protein